MTPRVRSLVDRRVVREASALQLLGAMALGALATGALAIGALAIGRLVIGRARIGRMEIDELVVRRLRVIEELQNPPGPDEPRAGTRTRQRAAP